MTTIVGRPDGAPGATPMMGLRGFRLLLPLVGLVLTTSALWAQPAQQGRPAAERRRAFARRAAEPIVIDGSMDDRAWRLAVPLSDFVQADPFEGQPATEKTEVFVLYDDVAIYVGVICYDSEPSKIMVTDSRRDSGLGDMDSFQMIFDTYNDRQNGFLFGTSATGMQYDAQVRNEGETQATGPPTLGRVAGSGGSGGGLNVNWDGSWDVKARITDIGWTAEFRIPLRTLRYGPAPQVWGVNFTRNIRRKREQVYWAPVQRIFNLTRLSLAGELRDLQLKTPRNLKLMPYAITSANRNFTPGSTTDTSADWGVDAKVGVTSSLNLDLTYNTDFAQVEVDEQQINLTRFNLLFPEKRPFFLENRGLFAVGRNGEVDLFFSRAIGIGDNGVPLPILGGARLSGRTGQFNVGLLNMQTDAEGTTPGENFTAARLNREFGSRSNVGVMFVGRAATGERAAANDWNRGWGTDFRIGPTTNLTFHGFAALTETPGATEGEHAFAGGFEYRTRVQRAYADYVEVAGDFNPEVGFLERPDAFREISTGYFRNVRSDGLRTLKLREYRPHATFEGFWGFDGFQETATLHLDNALDFESGNFLSPGMNVQYEGLRQPFEVYPGVIVPPGSYRSPFFFLQSNTDRRQWLSGGLAWNYGGFLSGHQNAVAPTVTVRKGGIFQATLRLTRNDIDLPQGRFVTNLGSLRMTYNFTNFVNVQGLIQYNDLTRRWSTNVRFNWLQTAATGLYVVYNDTTRFDGLGPANRAFVVKYVHLFDVLR